MRISTTLAILFCSILALCLTGGCREAFPSDEALAQSLPGRIDFNFHVKPILSDRCFACHGPDEEKQEAGLALHEPDLALAELRENPGHFAIVPGRPARSELVKRIHSSDPEQMMPPPESNLQLSEYEIAILTKWIEQGAEYRPHWSFIPPKAAKLPKVKNKEQSKNEVDHFILSRLERERLQPAAEADKETLIRRLSFDLRGLPPTLEEIDAFLADPSPDAYEKLADRFLASPAYGERMAAHWLDVARYADSDGYLDDKHRDFSPWRDWVIKAFNENLPYDDFITWQLAGDLLPEATQEQVLATAFNRLHKKNSEAGIVFEEYRVEYVADRTNTLGKAVLGLSLECARCHDHKYDPVSQKEYFELFAFFNSTDEMGHAVYGPDQTPGPALLLTDEEVEEQLDFVNAQITERERTLKDAQLRSEPSFDRWLKEKLIQSEDLKEKLRQDLAAHIPFDHIDHIEGEKAKTPNLAPGRPSADLRNPLLREGPRGHAFFVTDYNNGSLPKDIGVYERTEPFSIDLWLYPDTLYKEAGIFLTCENLRLGYKGYSLHLKNNRLQFIIAHSWPQNAVEVRSVEALPVRKWTKVSITYDGSSRAAGVRLFLDGELAEVDVERDHLYKGILYEWDIHTYGFNGFTFGQRDKVTPFKHGGLDELRIYDRALTPLEILHLYDPEAADAILKHPADDMAGEWLLPYYRQYVDPNLPVLQDSLRASRRRANKIYNDIPEIMVMGDLPAPRPTYILDRGLYDAPTDRVFPNTPNRILAFPEGAPPNRLGLAQWLFDERHPLTARVIVNRIWQLHFGQGLVKTSEDFGAQGDLPSHPELLDWLAVWFRESGWDLKALHKKIVLSAAYRQSSVIDPEKYERDPENVLLARGPRFRLPAEMIRDNALAVSGLLVNKIGGESVYPYQPEGLWDEISNKSWRYKYLQEPGEGLYRRSIYSVWKRTSPPPSMKIFDIADRDVCTVRRRPTNTPLQALVLLNDPQYQEAARVAAQRIMQRDEKPPGEQLRTAFRLVTGRQPGVEEMKRLLQFYEQEKERFQHDRDQTAAFLSIGETPADPDLPAESLAALSLVVNSLMNTDEAVMQR
jgi:hypothetical protein